MLLQKHCKVSLKRNSEAFLSFHPLYQPLEILPSRHALHSSAEVNENCWFSERSVGFTSKGILVDKD